MCNEKKIRAALPRVGTPCVRHALSYLARVAPEEGYTHRRDVLAEHRDRLRIDHASLGHK